MSGIDPNRYVAVTDEQGNSYLCPFDAVRNQTTGSYPIHGDCVEREVVERYAGNISIRSQ